LIETASAGAGFSWVSGYRLIVSTEYGTDFINPITAYEIFHGKGPVISVFQTSWDDKFFFPSLGQKLSNSPERTVAEALSNIKEQIISCRTSNTPCVISLHPYQFLKEHPRYSPKLLIDLLTWCKQEHVQVKTFSQLCVNLDNSFKQ